MAVVSTSLPLPLRGPSGEPVDLVRTLNSHGFAELAPTTLDETATDALRHRAGAEGSSPPDPDRARDRRRRPRARCWGPRPGLACAAAALAGAAHVLRLDHDLSRFYGLIAEDPDLSWAATGAGRMLRSPTVFEDVVKTICTTNCAWGATVRMVNALVSSLGEPAIGGDGPLDERVPDPDDDGGGS